MLCDTLKLDNRARPEREPGRGPEKRLSERSTWGRLLSWPRNAGELAEECRDGACEAVGVDLLNDWGMGPVNLCSSKNMMLLRNGKSPISSRIVALRPVPPETVRAVTQPGFGLSSPVHQMKSQSQQSSLGS